MAKLPKVPTLKTLSKCPIAGKYTYETEELAHAGKKQYRKTVGPRLHPYKCKDGNHWHLGHNRSYKRRQQIKSLKSAMVKA